MNDQKYPQLERLHILRTETLCSIRDRAFDGLQLFLKNYSDGIVSGCELHTTKKTITLSAGIILHNNFLYFIKDEMSIDYAPTEKYVMLKMVFLPEILSENFIQRDVKLVLPEMVEEKEDTEEKNLADNEMELCRFKLKSGAILRTNHTDFFDFSTEFDTINFINVPYADKNKSTLSPKIIFEFANEARDFELESEDFVFCQNALSGKIISAEQIAFYIEHRLQIELPDKKNQTLYENLCIILQEITSGNRREIKKLNRRRREIMLD